MADVRSNFFLRPENEVVVRLTNGGLVQHSCTVEEQRLHGFVGTDLFKLHTNDDPVTLPLAE
ncbi:hypothetical protein D3C79_1092320 [compost metagenome]